ncbi:HTH-type transcriptional activator IlvY [Agaribacter marinus]|uniref:Transcriptional regulator IlvY n=1 Tax=Agaribacter marinus TaxID=1431249 RepID=A0AA37T0D7_9ALTE|nr:HTH-type transcriptional activator IlvY [Agaribacter marinus]GLR71385.1 transcriptional regulator IlvY [Agaribacter marinus]
MDIKSLKLFQHLANSLHYSKTAQAMFVSPPTLSRVITRLEEEFNTTLFIRNNRKVALTKAGQTLLAFTDNFLSDYTSLVQTLNKDENVLKGELSLFCSVTASQSYLPAMLDRLREQHPQVDIKLDTGDHALAVEQVASRQVDISIAIHTPDFPSNVYFQQIDTVPLTLIVPKQMPIDRVGNIRWQNIKVIMPARGPSKRIVHHWFAEQNIRPNVYAQVSGNEAIVSMVSLGLGVGFVPRIVLENSAVQHKVKSLAVNEIEAYRLGLCYLKERSNEPLIHSMSQLFAN